MRLFGVWRNRQRLRRFISGAPIQNESVFRVVGLFRNKPPVDPGAQGELMGKLPSRIELLANVAILLVAGLLSMVLAKGLLYRDQPKPMQQIQAGTKISVPDIEWAQRDQTLLITLQKGCHYCAESAPFYQRLARGLESGRKTQLIAVMPQATTETLQYLRDLSVPISNVRQATLGSLKVAGTPTLIMVNREGVVTDVWIGKLSPEKESEVLSKLQCDACGS